MVLTLDDDPLLKRIPLVEGWKVLAPVVLYAKIGQGGMGSVYRGRHLDLDIDVAVKCLKPSLAAEDEQFIARFRREAKLAAGLTHENLVRVYDYRRAHGLHYLVMEFVDGETARERVKRKGPLTEMEAATIILGAARGLAKAHRNQETIVHRDVKPDNILISRRGEVKLADLGIAKALEHEDGATFNTTGVLGTPQYMAPEQWERDVDLGPQADVWSFGVTLYFLLTGENAIRGGNERQVYVDVCQKPFPDVKLKRPELSEGLARILERCVRKDMRERYADAGDLAGALTEFVGRKSPSLVDSDTGAERMAPLVSPPPMPTMRRIRTHVENKGDKKGGGPPTPTDPTIAMGGRSRSRWWWIGGGVAAALLVTVLAITFFQSPEPGDDSKSRATADLPVDNRAANPVSETDTTKRASTIETPVAPAAPPTIEVLEPKPGPNGIVYVSKESFVVSAHVGNALARPLTASLNGKPLTPKADGDKYTISAKLPADKPSTIELSCAGVTKTVKAFYDSKDPVVTVESPDADAPPTNQKSAAFVVRVIDDNPASVRIGETAMIEGRDGTWRADAVSLPKDGELTFEIVATDRVGRSGEASVRITRDTSAPTLKESDPEDGDAVDGGKSLELELVFNEAIAAVVVEGRETRGTKREAKVSVDVPEGSGLWKLEGTARDLAGNSGPFSVSLRRTAKTTPSPSPTPSGAFVRFDGFEVVGNEHNALNYPRVIKHTASGIELQAVDLPQKSKPSLYVSSTLINKKQYTGKGKPNEIQVGVSADAAVGWCLGCVGLELPTKADWQKMSKSSNPAISRPSTAYGELFQGDKSATDWPIRTQKGDEGKQPRSLASPSLGFRVVFRVP